MKRFANQPLRTNPHIAVLFSEKVGGFVAVTPLLRGLHRKYPGCTIDYFGGELTREFELASSLISSRASLYGRDRKPEDLLSYIIRRRQGFGDYDLVVNLETSHTNRLVAAMLQGKYVCGPCLTSDFRTELPFLENEVDYMWLENDWGKPDFLQRHSGLFNSGFIGEIFCRLAYVPDDPIIFEVPRGEIQCTIPEVLIGTSTTRAVKRWTTKSWIEVINWCTERGLSVGLLGSHPSVEQQFYTTENQEQALLDTTPILDMRGHFTLLQVAQALSLAQYCVAIDAGIMHIATVLGTPTVAIFGNLTSYIRLWSPPLPNLAVVTSDEYCNLCELTNFKTNQCLQSSHACMERIKPEKVINALQKFMSVGSRIHNT